MIRKLNLPESYFRIKKELGKELIFDPNRKKFVVLTPEEWVRQNFVAFLVEHKSYPRSLLSLEKQIHVNGLQRRFDLLVYRKNGVPHLIAEFKAPEVKISQEAFDQVVRYNMALKADYIVVSNGLQHFVCAMDYPNNTYSFLREVPDFAETCRNAGPGFS